MELFGLVTSLVLYYLFIMAFFSWLHLFKYIPPFSSFTFTISIVTSSYLPFFHMHYFPFMVSFHLLLDYSVSANTSILKPKTFYFNHISFQLCSIDSNTHSLPRYTHLVLEKNMVLEKNIKYSQVILFNWRFIKVHHRSKLLWRLSCYDTSIGDTSTQLFCWSKSI